LLDGRDARRGGPGEHPLHPESAYLASDHIEIGLEPGAIKSRIDANRD
jgi:hypothetical protein